MMYWNGRTTYNDTLILVYLEIVNSTHEISRNRLIFTTITFCK